MSASELRERLAFDARADLNLNSPAGDGYGNTEGDWQEQFRLFARVQPMKGGETVMASRLTGAQPVIIKVRYSNHAATITTGWRARDVRSGAEYNIRGIANMDEKRDYLDILAETGVAI